MVDRREEFDKTALSCITYLESFPECSNVNFQCGDGAASHESLLWEKKNVPYKLPKDLKSFLSMFNGVYLGWSVELGGKSIQIGDIRVNRMESIRPIEIDGTFDCKSWNDVSSQYRSKDNCAAFSLDAYCDIGEVVLLYRTDKKDNSNDAVSSTSGDGIAAEELKEDACYEEPEVWFVDQSSRWHYMCKTFTEYFRLLVLHFGLYGWQLAFTPEGLPLTTQQWMGIFCKERLIVDKHWRERLLSAK